jgi:cyclopropane fatty-acyl-phospholipid synthase-like methyltransferase
VPPRPRTQLRIPDTGSVADDRYGSDPFGRRLSLESAGPLALLTGDQLHPPLVDSEEIWTDGSRWHEGARRHVRQAAELCALEQGLRVLDVGAGLGGPARLLVDEYGVEVVALNVVQTQHENLVRLNEAKDTWKRRIRPVLADASERLPVDEVDVVWSMNMLYHLDDHRSFLAEARRVLPPGGRIMVDDWMLTDRAGDEAGKTMERHFAAVNVAVVRELVRGLAGSGFAIADVLDCGVVARTHLARHFRETFDRDLRPLFAEEDPQWGEQLASEFVEGIEETIELYRREELTYLQIAAVAL